MAYAHPVQRRVVVPGQAPLIVVDPRTLVFSPAPPPPPVGYLPGAIPAIASPAFPGVVVAPVALRLNPASLLRIDEQRTHELIQVIFFLLFFLDFFFCVVLIDCVIVVYGERGLGAYAGGGYEEARCDGAIETGLIVQIL